MKLTPEEIEAKADARTKALMEAMAKGEEQIKTQIIALAEQIVENPHDRVAFTVGVSMAIAGAALNVVAQSVPEGEMGFRTGKMAMGLATNMMLPELAALATALNAQGDDSVRFVEMSD